MAGGIHSLCVHVFLADVAHVAPTLDFFCIDHETCKVGRRLIG